jgi:hypothetical protein
MLGISKASALLEMEFESEWTSESEEDDSHSQEEVDELDV